MANNGLLGIPGSELVGLPAPQSGWFIAMWSGATTAIPLGWQLCDGTGGVPDLRDKFVVGAGSTYAVGATGGAATNTPSFTGTPLAPHGHIVRTTVGNVIAAGGDFPNVTGTTTDDSAGTPSGTISDVPTLPPYYAICFIAYVGCGSV